MPPQDQDKDKASVDSYDGSCAAPEDEDDWEGLARKMGLLRSTIHQLTKMASGSRVFKKQFVMIRAVWPYRLMARSFLDARADYGLLPVWDTAQGLIDNSPEFQKFFALVEKDRATIEALDENDPRWAGSLMPVLRYMRLCSSPVRSQTTAASVRSRRPALRMSHFIC